MSLRDEIKSAIKIILKMNDKIFISHSEQDTLNLGRELGKNILPGVTVLLYGDLGTGKTVLVRGVGEAMKISGVRSPSFTLINEYSSPSGIFLIHSDLYRLDENGVYALGLEEFAGASDSVLFIEWPERWTNPPVNDVIKIFLKASNKNEREIKISASGLKAEEIVRGISNEG
ncbi:MAG: tRNA (adenosine(37)-N6)-threonylcarbamoyltransferase complex ATPase subunit type 1 TsaE [Synergistales bacterium]|nr:tRNA (adenosine(37)-N6)-threonylcarbamoyltransferase complex ATPase subunit type 1 TsaE [Synergistales bacterium]MDY6401179.1 tRNA (adenosine(37)-N6)-threonylcarbamoyltransferase complex ATPase subunit type 1 TsaE [Synergistales bacterium]MDY6404772.1 tRNA (adenosine(37)-N6)-threonylcarbamoyltransferase complex ATPase subunit type 1 TsaE [Synergistales bacterium]MDY6409978.1 tRNA (adenosine(37)-N6)-threonylcarbamoyltransferase complex ATPase subunit type 1 TsaE [Synergistales bacterium]MDY64